MPITHVSVSNDGKCMLASCLDSKLRLLETDTGELLNAYSGHEATSMRAEGRLSHDDACVLSTSEDGRVVAWDIVQAVMVRQFKVSDLLQSNEKKLSLVNIVSDANNSSMPPICLTTAHTGVYNSSHINRLSSAWQVQCPF